MNAQLTKMYGVLVAALAVAGLFMSGHMFDLMNTDAALDGIRVLLAGYLLYAGFISRSPTAVRSALLTVGILYVGMGLIGLFSPTVGGMLPSGLTGFDIAFHLITGAIATMAALYQESGSTHNRVVHG